MNIFDTYQIGMKCIKDRLSKSNLSDRNCIAIQNQTYLDRYSIESG